MEGGEVRGVNIVYFLSRKGHIEHPHLIRAQHLSRNGVRLRDVKKWLVELRGKELSDSFSWSYKRKYKTGYVWQDLVDDDLITPISDNEYVLKGSEKISTNIIKEEKEKCSKQKEQQPLQQDDENATAKQEDQTRCLSDQTTKSQSESPSFESSSSSTMTDDSDTIKHVDKAAGKPSTFYSTIMRKKSNNNNSDVKEKKSNGVAVESCKSSTAAAKDCNKGKNNSNSASKMLKNLISCGDVETKNSTVGAAAMKRHSMCATHHPLVPSAALCTREAFGGSQRVFGNLPQVQQHFGRRMSFDGIESMLKNKSKSAEQKTLSHKPVNGPNCSQCGKQFKPDKMQSHMKSCKGLKALSKCAEDERLAKH